MRKGLGFMQFKILKMCMPGQCCRCLEFPLFMPPTSKKLWEHIGFRLCVCPCVPSLKTLHARVLKFHIWIPHGKIADPYFFFLSELSPFLEFCPFEKIRMKSCQQDILKSIWGLKLGQLIGDDE